ncbi:MAG TPA: ureidoglycolate lyase [Xanthobacteraceae bacterium]|jgi:ureidoglycolate lyase|nr:ureidoglycolate lyase [Xanthobacteraceae bacterium]
MRTIPIAPLTKAAFAPFGEVVALDGATRVGINQGFAERVNGLARIDIAAEGGGVNVSLFIAKARPRPIAIRLMERHPLGSQLFHPLQDAPWLVVVCADPREPASYRAFGATGRQGVNYARNVWHHPLLVTADDHRFIVLDRAGPGANLEECWLEQREVISLAAA